MKKKTLTLLLTAMCVGLSGVSVASGKYDRDDDDDRYYHQSYSDSDETDSKYDDDDDKGSYSSHYTSSYTHSSNTYHSQSYDDSSGSDSGSSKRLVLNLVGTGEMYEGEVPDIDGDEVPDPAICFDVGLKDHATGEFIGSATDCLSEITPEGDGLKLIGTTFFYLPDGLIVSRGLTTVQPVLQETVTPEGNTVTHITGAASDKNSILKGYGEYWRHKGTVRLSGMVDLTNFAGNVGDPMFFDCLFVLNIQEKSVKWPYWYNWYRHQHYQDDSYDRRYHHDDSGKDVGYRDKDKSSGY